MYNSTDIAKKIRFETTNKGIKINRMLTEIGLGKNVMSHLDNGSMIKADSLGKIADYLEVSVDYLLGRTTERKYYQSSYNFGNHNTALGDLNVTNSNNNDNSTNKFDLTTIQIAEIFQELNLVDKAKVINFITELDQKK